MQEKYATLLEAFSQTFQNKDSATELIKCIIMDDAIKEIINKNPLDDSFAYDLNPHLTIDSIVEQVKIKVEAEGLTCEKYDVALLWLTRTLIDKVNA